MGDPLLVGIGLRDAHAQAFLRSPPSVDFVEVITENVLVDDLRRARLREVRARRPVHLHGLSMNLASTDPLDKRFFRSLRALAAEVEPFLISDHLCWTGLGGRHTYDLLPFPFSRRMLEHLVRRVSAAQDLLGQRLVVENTSTYVRFELDELSEFEFTAELLARTGAGLLFDVNNLFVNAWNHGFDAHAELERLNPDTIAAYHLAGHTRRGKLRLDTHDRPVLAEVWRLFDDVLARFGPRPATLEWDDRLPSLARLVAEAERMRPRLTGASRAA